MCNCPTVISIRVLSYAAWQGTCIISYTRKLILYTLLVLKIMKHIIVNYAYVPCDANSAAIHVLQ